MAVPLSMNQTRHKSTHLMAPQVLIPQTAAQQVAVHAIGNGGAEDLSNVMVEAGPSWALLRCVDDNEQGADKIAAIACRGTSGSSCEHPEAEVLSPHILQLLGDADVTLHLESGKDLPEKLRLALQAARSRQSVQERQKWSAEQALDAIGSDASPYNWVMLEPTKLQLHSAGCGGLEELKSCLSADKVLFGVLRFCFPREHDAPPIAKYMFIHFIGSSVSVVKRGQWNSKLEDAVSKIRRSCDVAFRKTAYNADDLNLISLIDELARVTCVVSSDTRQLSVEWYLEGLQQGGELITQETAIQTDKLHSEEELSCGAQPSLRESAAHAIKIVREHGRQWRWVLLTLECRAPSSGGA